MPKKKVGIFIHDAVADALDEASGRFAHRKGLCISAAILMFLESEPEVQRRYVERVAIAELDNSVQGLLLEIRAEQARRTGQRPGGSNSA